MPAFVQPCDYVIRFGPEAEKYGDPYIGSISAIRNGSEVELVGYAPGADGMQKNAKELHRDILACLARLGFTAAIVKRKRKDGTEVKRRFDLTARSRKPL